MLTEQLSVCGTKAEQRVRLVDRKLVEASQLCYCLLSKGAHLFWFFGDYRYGVQLFIVILVIYKIDKNRCRVAGDYPFGKKLQKTSLTTGVPVVSDVFWSFFPRDVLDEIWDLTESVSKGFPMNE